jgi:hypothetical protein
MAREKTIAYVVAVWPDRDVVFVKLPYDGHEVRAIKLSQHPDLKNAKKDEMINLVNYESTPTSQLGF